MLLLVGNILQIAAPKMPSRRVRVLKRAPEVGCLLHAPYLVIIASSAQPLPYDMLLLNGGANLIESLLSLEFNPIIAPGAAKPSENPKGSINLAQALC